MIWIAGVNVKRDVVPELADRLVHADDGELAAKLLKASADGETEISLSIDERDAILAVLGDPPEELEELHGMLQAERQRRRHTRHGRGKKGRRNR